MSEQQWQEIPGFREWKDKNLSELTDIIGAARAGFAAGHSLALEQIGAGGVGDVSPVRADPPQTEERAAFEAWAPGQGLHIDKDEKGEYRSLLTMMYFGCWQARAALSSAPAREPMTREQMKELMGANGYASATAQERADFINGFRNAERHHGICKE